MSPKLRIALCITELRVGGAERILVELASRLDKSRFEPFVCSMKPRPSESDHHVLDALSDANIPVEFANVGSMLTLPYKMAKLRKIFKTHKPHVCQSFLFHANFFSRFAARLAGVPLVISGIRVAEHEKMWHLRLDRMTQFLVDRYVCVSKGVAAYTAKKGGIPQQKIVAIANGVDLADYENTAKTDLTQCHCAAGTRKIIVIGRLHHQKGIDWLLQTTPHWLAPRPDCELLIVGDGPERVALEQVAAKLPCHDRIRFLGQRRDVPQLLVASDLLLLPSRWEGMPNVVMQAMAAGLPVLATEVEGIDELLLRQKHRDRFANIDDFANTNLVADNAIGIDTGFSTSPQTCRFGQTNEFATKVGHLLDHPEHGRQLGEQNREHIRQYFTIEQMVNSYERLWLSLYENHLVK